MTKQGKRSFWTAAAVFGVAMLPAVVDAQVVAHWSFDTPTLTTDVDGNIVGAADSTGNHNAVAGTGIGSASVGNGGPTFTSNVIPGTNSVAGQFGQGLVLTGSNNFAGGGGQFLMFPELTELMAASGAPSYTVSYWIKTVPDVANAHQFTLLSNWGNSATTPGRFVYGFGFQLGTVDSVPGITQMRAQTRFDNGTGGGGDIYARATPGTSAAALESGDWHMLTWTFDTTTGMLTSYFDGAPIDSFQSAASSFAMTDSSSAFGSIGLKGDSGNFINGTVELDEVWVLSTALSPAAVRELYNSNVVIPEPTAMVLASLCAMMLASIGGRRRN